MATRPILPNLPNEGYLGSPDKPWGKLYVNSISTILRDYPYDIGDIVMTHDTPSWSKLVCIQPGVTGTEPLDCSSLKEHGDTIEDGSVIWALKDTRATISEYRKYYAGTGDVYVRDRLFSVAEASTPTNYFKIVTPNYHAVVLKDILCINNESKTIDIQDVANWDNEIYATANKRAGKDFYIYAILSDDTSAEDEIPTFNYLLSANPNSPINYDSLSSKKIGGFHCLCAAGQPYSLLKGYPQGAIIPPTFWDLKHRPVADPEGMTYSDELNIWIDIYLNSAASGTVENNSIILQSKFDQPYWGNPSNAQYVTWYMANRYLRKVHKRLPTKTEFLVAAMGSNEHSGISAPANYQYKTGGHSTTDAWTDGNNAISRSGRMVSDIGCEDMVGYVQQYVEVAPFTGTRINGEAYWADRNGDDIRARGYADYAQKIFFYNYPYQAQSGVYSTGISAVPWIQYKDDKAIRGVSEPLDTK